MTLLKKALVLSLLFVLAQLLLMGLAWMIFDIDLFEIESEVPQSDLLDSLSVTSLKLFILLNQLIGIFLPAIAFLLIFSGRNIREQIDWRAPGKGSQVLLSLALLVFSLPVIQYLATLNDWMGISNWLKGTAGQIENYMTRIVQMDNPGELAINLLLIAVVPAISEELFFRGMLQKELLALFRSPHPALFITALVFSAFHFQFDGFLPRLGLGLILGYAYFYTRSFAIPVLMHFTNNAMMVFALWYKRDEMSKLAAEGGTGPNIMIILLSVVIVVYLIWNLKMKNLENGSKEIV